MRAKLRTGFRSSFTARLWLWGTLIFALTFVMVLSLVWVAIRDDTRARLTHDVDASLDEMNANLQRRNADLETLADWLAQQNELGTLILQRDNTALTRYLQPIERTSIVDSIVVINTQGAVLWRETNDQVSDPSVDVLNQASIADALSGRTFRGLARDQQGHLEQRLILPAYAADFQTPVGAVVLAFYLDGDLFKNLPKEESVSTVIVYRFQVVASSINDSNGKMWQGTVLPPGIFSTASADQPSEFSALSTSAGTVSFKFRPLLAPDRTVVGYYGAGVPTGEMGNPSLAVPGFLGLAGVLATGAMLIFLLLLARILAAPVQKLTTAVAFVADGDLATHIAYSPGGEIGDAFRSVDRVRGELQRVTEIATFDRSYHASVIQGMPAAAIITDADYRIISVNAAAQTVLQQNAAALINEKWQSIFTEDGKDGERYPVLEQPRDARARFSLRSQPRVVLDIRTSPIQVNGVIEGYVHVAQDVSEQTRFEQSKKDFVLNLAHELRSPLASLRAYIDLIAEDHAMMPKHDLGVMLRTLQRVVIKFQGLTENLIDIGSLQTGQFTVRPVPTPIGPLIEDSVDQTQQLLHSTGQRLDLQVEDAQALVWADRPRITQVVVNLLNNAHKYSPENSVITLATWQADERLFVAVTDHGGGIEPEEQPLIFARYFRGKRAEQEGMGIGVGLALVRGIVQAHEGQVSVKSVPGETTFSFSLPAVHSS